MSATNSCNFVGRLGKDPVIRIAGTVAKPVDIANFRIAVNDYIAGRESTVWVNIVAFNGLAGSVKRNASKGTLVTVEGRMQERQWKDKTGNTRYVTEIIANGFQVLAGRKAKDAAPAPQRDVPWEQQPSAPQSAPAPQSTPAPQPQRDNGPIPEPPPFMDENYENLPF